jgi:peptide/nickel transport system substrate-binding protein
MVQRDELQRLGQEWTRRGLRRRDFLRLAASGVSVAAIGGILAACGGEVTPTTASSAAPSTAPSTAASTAPTVAASTAPTAAASTAPTAATGGAPTASATRASGTATAAGTATTGGSAGAGFPSGGKYTTADPVGKKGGNVVEVIFADGKTNNPMLTSDNVSSNRIGLQFLSLLDINPDNALPFPSLATQVPTRENGGISQDGLTYTFKLRNDVKWHDGQQFTAKDVVFTYQTMMKKELASPRTADLVERVASASNPDDYTVIFKLNKIVAPFLVSNCASAGYGIVPQHILGSVAIDQIKQHPFSTGDAKASIGTGPFKFKEWVKDDHATFVKNANYFLGEPALDSYISKVVKDSTAVVASLKTGEGDWGGVSSTFYEEMQKQQAVTVNKYDTYNFEFAAFQIDPAKTTLFQQKEVRQALTYALDRDAMAQAIYNGLATVAQGTEPTLSFAYAPDQMKTKYTYDPKKTAQLLDAAGWVAGSDGVRAKDGKKLQFTIWTNAGNKNREALITVMQQQWKAIGVDATPKTEDFASLVTRITETHDFEVAMLGFVWDVDPDQGTMWSTKSYEGGFNLGKYSNPQVDKLIESGLTELDTAKRKQIYIDMQNAVLDDAPSIILVFPQAVGVVNKRLHNCKPNAVNIRYNAHLWWVEDGK